MTVVDVIVPVQLANNHKVLDVVSLSSDVVFVLLDETPEWRFCLLPPTPPDVVRRPSQSELIAYLKNRFYADIHGDLLCNTPELKSLDTSGRELS